MTLTDIPGIGASMGARLARAGIHDFLSLWRIEPKQARAIWGSIQGERFWYALHGHEVEEPATKKSMIGHSRVLSREHERADAARIVARALLLKAASRLRHYGLFASALSVSVRLRPEGGRDGARRFAYSQNTFCFLRAFDEIWNELFGKQAKGAQMRCGAVTIYLAGFAAEGDAKLRQGDLFEPANPADDRQARLWRAIDRINADPDHKFRRLGRRADAAGGAPARPVTRHVMLARQSGLNLNYLGVKIAFSRVPEEAEFLY